MTQGLKVSIAINVLLTAGLVAALVLPKLTNSGTVLSASTGKTSSSSGSYSLRTVEQALRSAGLNDGGARRGAYLIYAADHSPSGPYEYWKPTLARDASSDIASFQRDEEVRAAVLKEYGEEAKSDTAFDTLFRPYQRELPMLSAEQQLRLQALRVERLKATAARSLPTALPGNETPELVVGGELQAEPRFEYDLRESALARSLSALSFDFSEREFREVFRIFAQANPDGVTLPTAMLGNAAQNPAVSRSLEEALGAERYGLFSRTRDPRYAMLRRVAALRGVDSAKVDQAYTILLKSGFAGQAASKDQVQQELVALVGADSAADIMRAFQGPGQPLVPGRPGAVSGTLSDGRLFRMPSGASVPSGTVTPFRSGTPPSTGAR
jgi:hypothetical protein